MKWLLNVAMKFSGLGWVWGKIDGSKTYIAAGLAITTGLAGVLAQLQPVLAGHDAAALLAFLKGLPNDPAWLMLVGGFGALGIGHKLTKAAEAAPVEAPKP